MLQFSRACKCDEAHSTMSTAAFCVCSRFSIHGLWPEYTNGSWPQFCTSNCTFSESPVNDLLPKLRASWPSLFHGNDAFWRHEYCKHGSCARAIVPDEHAYFDAVLKLNERFDLNVRTACAPPSRVRFIAQRHACQVAARSARSRLYHTFLRNLVCTCERASAREPHASLLVAA